MMRLSGSTQPLIYTVAMFVARRFVVKGRVQGVGFRAFAEGAARADGIHGWVANRADGSVEVYAEGEADAIARFDRRLRQGPSASRVDEVSAEDDVPSGRVAGFTIRS
jgi:acylphosphatase